MKWLLLDSGGVRLRPDAAESEPLSVRLVLPLLVFLALALLLPHCISWARVVFVYDILST